MDCRDGPKLPNSVVKPNLNSKWQGPQWHFEFGGAKKISGAAIYIKFEFFENKISTY